MAALTIAYRKREPVKPEHIAELASVSERMARQCLLIMSDAGWLDRRAKRDGSVQYVPPSDEEWADF